MKKHLITAVLAIVAVGGVFAGTADKKITNVTRYTEIGSPSQCTEITCSDSVKPLLCSTTPVFINNNSGVCENEDTIFIYRQD